MTTTTLRLTNEDLRAAADRLVAERRDLPPGSVLSLFSQAVRSVLLTGCPPARVAVEAEQRVREALAGHYAAEWREQRPALRTGLRRGLRGLPRAPRGR